MTTKIQKLQDEIEEAQAAFEKNIEAYANDDLDLEDAGMHMFNEGFLMGLKHALRIQLDARFKGE
jgi:hypothetical protein